MSSLVLHLAEEWQSGTLHVAERRMNTGDSSSRESGARNAKKVARACSRCASECERSIGAKYFFSSVRYFCVAMTIRARSHDACATELCCIGSRRNSCFARLADSSLQQSHDSAAQRVVPGVRDHSRTQTLPPPRQQSEHQAVEREQQHAGTAFVTVRCAEDDGRQHNADRASSD